MSKSRDLVQKALQHKPMDRVPVDFGSSPTTGIHCSIVEKLREYYGLEKRPVKVHEPFQMLGVVEDDLIDAIGIDTEGVAGLNTFFGFPNENWKLFTTLWGQEVLVPEKFNVKKDENGDLLIYPGGDTTAEPSARMPNNGVFFDAIIRQEPIDEENLDPEDNLEEFGPISEEELNHYKREVARAKATGRAVVAVIGGAGLGDIALVPAPFMSNPKGIRDVTEWYVSTVTRQEYLHTVFSKQTDYAVENFKTLYEAVGNDIDVAFICGTDFGTQTSTFCSPDTFKELYMPYYKKMTGWIHEHTEWKVFKHSCGAVFDFIPLFIEAGFDILNPVQLSAAGMDAEELKKQFGDQIVFWGGGVDTQKTLPFGTPEEVRKEVTTRLEILSKDSGYVFNTIHNVQAKTPIENLAAMFDAVHEFNGDKKTG